MSKLLNHWLIHLNQCLNSICQIHINFKTSDFSGIKELSDTKEKGKGAFKDREKNLESHKTYIEAQQADLFYSIAFFNKTDKC